MKVSDFYYHLPPELIAQSPLDDRSSSRMLVVHRQSGTLEDRHFFDLPEYLSPGDCLVINDSKVFPSRLLGTRSTGGKVEVFLLKLLFRTLDCARQTWTLPPTRCNHSVQRSSDSGNCRPRRTRRTDHPIHGSDR